MIATVIPTRGLLFARTVQSLMDNRIYDPHILSGKPIPDAYNEGVEYAIKRGATHLLFLEDDMVLPQGCIKGMLAMNKPIIALDYPMDNGYSTVCRKDGEVLWCGLGAMLINMDVFDAIERPWFTVNHSWKIVDEERMTLQKHPAQNKYGGHDINFCMEARFRGFPITIYPEKATHLRCHELQRGMTNSSPYTIRELEETHQQNYQTGIE